MLNLYRNIFYSEKVNELYTDDALINYMLQFEACLAMAQASRDVIPHSCAGVIKEYCKAEKINKEQLIADAGVSGNLVIPLIKLLTAVVKQEDKDAAKYVHFGATSQDVIDTALMLQTRDAVNIIFEDLNKLIKQLASLTKEHKDTIMTGRSFMQHARPITFGYKVAGWLDGLLRSQKAIGKLLKDGFMLQYGGAVGTLPAMLQKGIQVSETLSELLKLNNPAKPWHTERDRFAIIATTLGILTGNISKIAKDVSLMMQTEVAEVLEPAVEGKGGSSTMPHKRNPVGCIAILANSARIPSLVATMLSCMSQDHERATGYWHAEWETLPDIIQLTAGALYKIVELTGGLEVDNDQMLQNMEISNGLVYAENVSMALADKIGKAEAHELVEKCSKEAQSKKIHLKEIIRTHLLITEHLGRDEIEKLFDPISSVGLATIFIKRVLDDIK